METVIYSYIMHTDTVNMMLHAIYWFNILKIPVNIDVEYERPVVNLRVAPRLRLGDSVGVNHVLIVTLYTLVD